jgi:hypothetical protein
MNTTQPESTTPTPTSAVQPNPVYPRKPDGTINWRALVQPSHVYVKKGDEAKVATALGVTPQDIKEGKFDTTRVEDKHLVIRKAGLIELARIRGYTSAAPEVKHASRDYVVIQTHIHWKAFEEQTAVVTGGVGEASCDNTSSFMRVYLAAAAENRAFSRAVRQFLNIDIVSADELGGNGVEPEVDSAPSVASSLTPQGVLQKTVDEAKSSFDKIKAASVAKFKHDTEQLAKDPAYKAAFKSDPSTWMKYEDISALDCMTLIELINKSKTDKAKVDKAGKQAGK